MASSKYPGQTTEAYPDVFGAVPPQHGEKKAGQLDDKQLKQFFEEGYVLVENFFQPGELEPAKASIEKLVDDLANRLHENGKIENLHQDCGFFQRLTMLDKEFPGAAIILHKLGVLPQGIRDLWANEKLLNVAEQLLGTQDIVGHPVWNLRTKIPQCDATTVPWHQDCGYLDNDSYKVLQLTAWIPFLNSTPENGCMQVMRGGHKKGRVANHTGCWRDTWYMMLDEEEMKKTLDIDPDKEVVTCPVPYGGVLLFSNAIPHRSLANTSNDIRWSLDLRWQRADMPTGFYGLKHGVRMRSPNNPNHVINWEDFDNVDRHPRTDQNPDADFDTRIAGPWMSQWEITHSNRHTDYLEEAMKTMKRYDFTVY